MLLYHVLYFKADQKKQITRMVGTMRQKLLKYRVILMRDTKSIDRVSQIIFKATSPEDIFVKEQNK